MPHINPWFPDAKFGVFIHWLLKNTMDGDKPFHYRDEPYTEYAREAASKFTAEHYDAQQWAKMFRSWGARYAVMTTKHHIGFTLYDYEGSPFTAAADSPAGRDLVRPYCDALRAEGLKVGLYFSQPDWMHPDYASLTGGDDPKKYAEKDDPERWNRFVEHMFAEVRHLCTAYGDVDLMWFDGDWERTVDQWHNVELVRMIENLQPGIVLNNRLRHACLGHYATPEQAVPLAPRGGWWEQCMTIGKYWHYDPDDVDKPVGELVRVLCDVVSMGGNLLLNISPLGDGSIPPGQIDRMEKLGEWINPHAEAIFGTERGLPAGLFNGASTHKGSVLYLITYDRPRELAVKGVKGRPSRITHLVSGKELTWRISGGREKFGKPGWLFIQLPDELVEDHATVVRVEFEDDVAQFATPSGDTLTWRGRPKLDEQATYEAR